MNDELERIWKETVVAYSRYYRGVFLVGMRKITTDLSYNAPRPKFN
jgi:hypothetical protein